jgi:Flp pilus assembly pilin Flp
MDYAVIVTAISVAGLLAAIGATAIVKIGPQVGKWGVNKLISMFR